MAKKAGFLVHLLWRIVAAVELEASVRSAEAAARWGSALIDSADRWPPKLGLASQVPDRNKPGWAPSQKEGEPPGDGFGPVKDAAVMVASACPCSPRCDDDNVANAIGKVNLTL